LLEAIVGQKLRPGTRLVEDDIGGLFGVSRTLVRSALQALAHERIVRIEANRGAFVASPTIEEARAVFDARRVLEAAIARRSAANMTRKDGTRLRLHLKEERQALLSGDRTRAILLSGKFHLAIAAIAAQPVLTRMLRELVAQSSLVIALYGVTRASVCGNDDHVALADALSARDGRKAENLMVQHILHIENDINLASGISSPADLGAALSHRVKRSTTRRALS
jgi:DNA-binding GntR family transcriptional regulator